MKSLQHLKVLLIEDNPSDVLLLRSALEADQLSAFTLTHVERLSDGLRQLEGEPFDIILTDLGLPDSSGLETFERLHEQAPDIPVIVFSGDDNEDQTTQSVRHGAQDYLVKSASGFDMAARSVRYAIERNKLHATLRESEQRFTILFRSNPVPVGITRQTDYCIVDVNDAWTSLTGYTRDEAIGHTSAELGIVKPEKLQQIRNILRDQRELKQFEVPLYRRSGEERQVLVSSEPIQLGNETYVLNNLLDITERKQAEDALKESEEKYRYLINGMNDTVWVIDFDTTILDVNTAAAAVLGYTREELLKMKISDIDHSIEPAQIQQLASSMPVEKSQVFESKHRTRDGRIIPVEVSSSLVTYLGKTVIMSIARDISERKQAQRALQESETRLKTMIESAMDAIITADQSLRIVIFNSAAERMFGMPVKEALGQPISRFIPDRFHDYHQDQMLGLTPEIIHNIPAAKIFSIVGLRANGDEFPAESTISYVEINGEKFFTAILRDVTERKKAEQALRTNEERLRKILQTTSDGFWLVDSNRRFLDINEAYCAMSGYTREELLQLTITDLEAIEAVSDTEDHIRKIMSEGRDFFETRHRRKDGTVFDVEVSVNLLGGDPRLMVCFCRDITQRKQAEISLRESQELYQQFIAQSFEAIYRTEFDQPVDTSLPVEEQIDQIYANAYMAECNQATADMYKIPLDDFIGTRLVDAHGGSDNQVNRDAFRKLIKNGYKSIDDETLEYDAFGNQHWFLSNTVGTVEDGKLIHLWGTTIEITDRKQALEKLRASEQKLRSLVESQTHFVVRIDMQGHFTYWNETYKNEFGWLHAESDFQHANPMDSICAYHHQRVQQVVADCITEPGKVLRVELDKPARDGGIRTSLWEFVCLTNEFNQPSEIQCMGTEITDRKKTEDALRESNERFRQIAETIQEVFWMFDNREQRLLYVSPGLERLWGHPVPTLDEVYRLTMEVIYPEDRQLHLDLLIKQQQGQPTDGEYRIVHADGKIRWLHSRSFPVLDENGTLIRTTGIITDVTSRKLAEQDATYRQELLEKVIQLGKKIAAITDLEKCLYEIYQSARFGLGFDRIGLFLYDATLQHVLGVYGTTQHGEIEQPGFFDGSLEYFAGWQNALQNPVGISWLEDYHQYYQKPEGHKMHDVKQHLTVAAWSGEKPVALITADNLLTGRTITPADVEALQLFAGYAGLAIENASLNTELELKVEERTKEVQDLYDNAPAGYHSLDAGGQIIQINQTELNWLGFSREEVLGHSINEFITEASQSIFLENFLQFQKSGFLRDLELEMVRKDGSTFPVLINATAIKDNAGNFISSRTTVFDNTDRRQAEESLRESQANLQNFLDTASDIIQSLDENGNFIYVNTAWCEALGYTQEDALKMSMFDVVDPQFHAHCRAALRELVANGQAQHLEIVFRTQSGEVIIAEGNVSGRRNKDGRAATNGIFRNITKRKQAEDALQHANVELERALRLKDEFLASMSHELRTPLTGILGLSEALQYNTYGELNLKQKNIIANIENNGRHLLELINDILDISKMEAGKFELDMAPCQLGEICQSSLQLVKGMAHKKGQQITFSINPASIVVKGDVRRIKQIIVNLLSNAIKYSPEKSPIGLEVSTDETTQTVKIVVWDHGMGISSDDLKRLFQPFVQLDSSLSRQQSGTGLGLALVQRLVDLHGGSIQIESKPGQGSRFMVRLPYIQGNTDRKDDQKPEIPTEIQLSLIVEDNAIDANRLTRFLKMLGIQSQIQPIGEGVIERALEMQPSVILLDINLPDINGWVILEKLKQNEATRDIPVVITSVVEERERANHFGAAGYLLKIFTLDELRDTLAQLPRTEKRYKDTALIVSPRSYLGTVMIVDDNEINILMIEDFLRSRNYNVFSALSGLDFLAQVNEIRPDIILMDIQMPDMDGLETIRRLRSLTDPGLASIPVIAITALAMPGDRERCLDAGANDYISKPVRLKELVSTIHQMLLGEEDIHE